MNACLSILNKEWESIDYHRTNKFLFLVRCIFTILFEQIADLNEKDPKIKGIASSIKKNLFSGKADINQGLFLHYVQIFVSVVKNLPPKLLTQIMKPIISFLIENNVKRSRDKILEFIFEELEKRKGEKKFRETLGKKLFNLAKNKLILNNSEICSREIENHFIKLQKYF